MSIHISADKGEIAKIVLLAGDPLRAKHIAENNLSNIKLVSSTRNAFYFTGTYKEVRVTIGASGMGCASIGIYSYELFNEYGAECIMRIGTAGAYTERLNLFDIVNAGTAFSESTYARAAFNFDADHFFHQGTAFDIINQTAGSLGIPVTDANIHSSDVFYRSTSETPEIAEKNDCLAVEMEAFALFANAKYLNKMAATLLTISDIIPSKKFISATERQNSLANMTLLALESAVNISKSLG